jgi:aryl-alcohol dehydrogenase-like predicted oxidoreductase
LLAAAYAHGFTHFDTAPYYGFGMAERDLASLLRRHPDITVATKVGIYSPGGEEQSARAIVLRKLAGKAIKSLSKPDIDWSVARARDALGGSLKRLDRDHIDLYLLHEPRLDLLKADEWQSWLEREKATGRIRSFGIAVTPADLPAFLAAQSPLADVIQTADSLGAGLADAIIRANRPLQVTAGYLSAARGEPGFHAACILTAALRRNTTGTVIVNTGKIARLKELAEIAADADHIPTTEPGATV